MMNARISRLFLPACAALIVVAAPRLAAAQAPVDGGSGLLFGPVAVRPTIVLRDAGWDSNIFNEQAADTDDHTATLSGRADARMRVGLVQIDGVGSADYLYFRQFTRERSLNRFVSTRLQPQFVRVSPYAGMSYRRTRDRANSEVDVRAPRTEHEYRGGFEARLANRLLLEGSLRRADVRFDEGERYRNVELAARLNRNSDTAEVNVKYELSPLTALTFVTSLTRDNFTESSERNSETLTSMAGFSFAPDAVIRGRALVGFRDLRSRGSLATPSRGPTSVVELSYTLLERTVFSGRVLHETAVSAGDHPFYVSTLWGFEVTHNLVGRVDVFGRGSREELDYDAVPAFALPSHLERVNVFGGGLTVRLGPHTKVAVGYEENQRRSDLPDIRDYDRRRVSTTISYGF